MVGGGGGILIIIIIQVKSVHTGDGVGWRMADGLSLLVLHVYKIVWNHIFSFNFVFRTLLDGKFWHFRN